MTRRLRCRLGLHRWLFAYAPQPGGKGYRPEVCCLRCVATPSARHVRFRALLCFLRVCCRQELLAPPTWRPGQPIARGRYCIFCASEPSSGPWAAGRRPLSPR